MQYRTVPKNGDKLSVLGFGTMRLPSRALAIDEKRSITQIRLAIDNGINYLDTAVPYRSEKVLGKALMDGYRQKVKVATKLTPSSLGNPRIWQNCWIYSSKRFSWTTSIITFFTVLMRKLGKNCKVLKY